MKRVQREKREEMQLTFQDRVFSSIEELTNELTLADLPKSARHSRLVSFVDCVFVKLDLTCWDFHSCYFERTKFESCYLDGTGFQRTTFTDCRLLGCSLRVGSASLPEFATPGSKQASFINTTMNHVVFNSCDLTEAYIKNSDLERVDFLDCTMYGTDFLDCKLSIISIQKCSLNAARFRESYFWSCDLSDTRVNEETRFILPEDHKAYDAYKVYYQAYKLFKAQGLDDISLEVLFLAKEFERTSSTNRYYRWWLAGLKYTCGYGEKPGRVVITSIALIALFALIHGLHGLSYKGIESDTWLGYVQKSLYYSAATFTTLGDGDVSLDGFGMLLTSLEAALGLLLTAVGTASFYKKLTS